jgi:hypothetical protein
MKSAHLQTIIPTLPKAVHVFLLAAIVFLAYGSNLDGAFIFDDSRIENNPALHITDLSLDSLSRAALESSPKTRPVAHLSFALNYYFHGFDTRGYHLVNICIHALAAVVLFLSPAPGSPLGPPSSGLSTPCRPSQSPTSSSG